MSSLVKSLSTAVCALALVSCASNPVTGSNNRLNTKLDVVPGAFEPGEHDPVAKAAFWGTRYDRDPDNAKVAVSFSEALRTMGSNDEAMKVMSRTFTNAPDDASVNLEYGKVLIANDRAFEAVRPLQQAIQLGKGNDWKAYSAYGVALDKIGEHREARLQYDQALKIKPNSHIVLNNKGLSYALSGKLAAAEQTLRFAAATTAGTPTVRQNLALVLAFKGDTSEAERLARSDLPPRVADNNVGYFRSLVNQPAYWQAIKGDNVEMPTFDTPASQETVFEPAPVPPVSATSAPTELAPDVDEPQDDPLTPDDFPAEPQQEPAVGAEVMSSIMDEEQPALDAFGLNTWSSINGPVVTETPVQLENTSTEETAEEESAENESGA